MSDEPRLPNEPMPVLDGTRWRIVGAALILGLGAEFLAHPTLFQGKPAGIGITILLAVPVVTLLAGKALTGRAPSRPSALLLIAALLIIPWLAVRAAPALIAVDLAAAFALVSVAAYRYQDRVPIALADHIRVLVLTPLGVAIQPLLFVRDDFDRITIADRQRARLLAIGRGLALAAIPVVVLGALLVSADAVFSNLIGSLFDFPSAGVFKVLGVTLLVAWVIVGLLRFGHGRKPLWEIPRGAGFLGATEVVTVLGSLTAMFALFVGVQFAYLFGGVDTIEATGGLTRAEYYRQGFFQLVVVAGLVTLLVLALDWWHRIPGRRPHRVVTGFFDALIALTGVMVVSALVRWGVYVDAFGLSQLRLYTAAFVIWIAVLLIFLGAVVVRGRREVFAPGAIAAAAVIVFALNAANPDAWIARVNIDRHVDSGVELDLGYLGTLSSDAVPAMIEHARGDACAEIIGAATAIVEPDSDTDFRTFHWGRSKAADAVAGQETAPRC